MKNAALSIVVLGVFVAGFLAGGWDRPREIVGATGLHGRKVLYYVDPMHPAYTSDKPGKAPDCGMPLEPVYDEASAVVARAVRVSSDAQHLVGVQVAAVASTAATEQLRLYGRVAPDETHLYRIDIGIEGFIRELSTVTTGSQVRKDQWLATLSAPDIRMPIQAYQVALELLDRAKAAGESPTQIALANASLQQIIDRLLTLGVSRAQLDEIARTKLLPPNIRIAAPADGFVLSRNASIGQKVDRGSELFRIADLRRVWILTNLSGPEAEHVRPGTIVQVSIPGRTGSLRARVSSDVRPQFDAGVQSVALRLDADNPEYLLRPDMFVDVVVPITLPPAIAVPVDAVVASGREKIVFVERGAGVFESRRVQTGWRFGERVEVVKGLAAGERIAVSGAFLLDSESRMRR
jgi:membrane fusion protein, copper/silver efflux system